MRKVFLDTFYLQGLASTEDDAHKQAISMAAKLGKFQGITSKMVLTELLNALFIQECIIILQSNL